jgi:hypothetical protein
VYSDFRRVNNFQQRSREFIDVYRERMNLPNKPMKMSAAYHSTKLKDLDRKVSLMWYNMGCIVDAVTDREICNELCVARGTWLQSICSTSVVQLDEILN